MLKNCMCNVGVLLVIRFSYWFGVMLLVRFGVFIVCLGMFYSGVDKCGNS